MDKTVQHALKQDRTIDITTTGRKSGVARRIEIWFHNIDDRLFITGRPNPRDWYANLLSNPEFTFHLKESAQADLPAKAIAIVDQNQKREILIKILRNLDRDHYLDEWVERSPLIEVLLDADNQISKS